MSDTFREGVSLFNEGLYFEAHDVWERAWNDAEGAEKRCLQALIQIAVAFLKWQSGIPGGALKMHKMACEKLASLPDSCLGISLRDLERHFRTALEPLIRKADAPFPERVFKI